MEISSESFRELRYKKRVSPGGASERNTPHVIPVREALAQPLPGLWLGCGTVRWLAPPANFRDASGVSHPATQHFNPVKGRGPHGALRPSTI
jgi:hypothetical protein